MKNIVLIGMPGSGKSTLGVLLAKSLGLAFIDTDLIIQEQEKRLLQEIINTDGINKFIEIEERVILSMNLQNDVIATGGSVVYSDASMNKLKNGGLIIYLELDFLEVEKRIKNISSRGIAMQKGQSLINLYKERVPLYEKYADITVNGAKKSIEENVELIRKSILPYS